MTYDDLWIQHRKELKNQFDNIEKYKLIFNQLYREINYFLYFFNFILS